MSRDLRQSKENAVRQLFNCNELFSVTTSGQDNCSEAGSDLLPLSDSDQGSILHASDVESTEVLDASSGDDSVLLASDAEDAKPPKRTYQKRRPGIHLLGKEVCVHALQSLLGIGSSTIQKIRSGLSAFTDKRREKAPKHPTLGVTMGDGSASTMWSGVPMFLWQTYHSTAEVMPTDFKMPRDQEVPVPEKKDPDFEMRMVNHFLLSLQTYGSDPEVHLIGPGTFAGPCRWLQASSRTELYWEYYASCLAKDQHAASYGTFLRVANAILRPGMRGGHLKFRGVNQHGKCNLCYELKLKIKTVRAHAQRQEEYRLYSHHLLSQWLDRQQYWSYRSMSQTWVKTMLDMGHKFLDFISE